MTTSANSKISFTWDLHYTCNYRCPYCWWDGRWLELAKKNRYCSVEELLKPWMNIYNRYGPAHIELLGGEPFLYPNFKQLVKELSQMHTIGITTNLSVKVADLVKETDRSKVSITGTFHPLFANFDDFLRNAVILKEDGRNNSVWYLAYPPQIKLMNYYKEKFNARGIKLAAMTFWGIHKGIAYPQGYTAEEKAFLKPFLGEREGEKFQLEAKKTKDRLCRAGQIYASIKSDGEVYRCGGSSAEFIGNFFNQGFKMLDEPLPCRSESCPCNEWAFLLVEKELGEVKSEQMQSSLGSFTVENIEKKYVSKKPVLIDRKKIPPHRVFFTWDIHYGCNYQCTYCNTPKATDSADSWDRDRMKVAYPSLERMIEIWRDIYERYGSSEIHITGGEPFVYPNFIELITQLSKIHTLEIITNLSSDVEKIIKSVTAERVRIGTTFHPEFADLKVFLKKHMMLRERGFETWVNYVAYPPILQKMAQYKSEFDKLRISFNIQPYLGFYEGKEYPAGYTDSELIYLKQCYDDDHIVNKKTIEWKTGSEHRNMKDGLCRMGQMYAKIYPVGDVYRCCANGSAKIGNLFDGSFELSNEPLPCECDHCFCWRCMLVAQENNWAQHWVIPQQTACKDES